MPFPATLSLDAPQRAALDLTLQDWKTGDKVRRLWDRDPSLWTSTGEQNWMGWLDIVQTQLNDTSRFGKIADEVRRGGYTSIVLLGMGGSSLCPEVFSESFGQAKGFPPLRVLDSTDPGQVLALDRRIDVSKSLFIVSSKSGSTLEPNIFKQYFFERAGRNGRNFWAITDPGSQMQSVAEKDGFAHIFFGLPSIGGRYSALSDFGMVPAAAMGLDVPRILDGAKQMAEACSPSTRIEENPGVMLGAVLGTLARSGRNKVTLICSPGIHDLGAWLEQLLAESTGKQGKGLIPVDREPLGEAPMYGLDRIVIYSRVEGGTDAAQERTVAALKAAGQPVVEIPVEGPYQLGAEFFRWEIATAVCGSILGINPFDQPDVEASKIATKRLTSAFEETGSLPDERPALEQDGIKVFGAATGSTLEDSLRAHLSGIAPGAYVALLAYIPMNAEHEAALNAMRERIRNATLAATCLGFGPRFLHSTGQAYKGGPAGGVFLQITCEHAEDVAVPGQKYSFGIVEAAQAQGDLEVLRERGRKTLRIHLGKDVGSGLANMAVAVDRALQ